MAKVRVKFLPKAQSGLETKMGDMKAGLGLNTKQLPWPIIPNDFSEPDIEFRRTLPAVPREQANLEAEKGEVAMTPGGGGIPNTFLIGGEKHYNGGTPLRLPSESFIYSDTKNMRIKDPIILKQFGVSSSMATPAEIAKKYDIGKFKKVLADPDSDDLQRQTAEAMIKNYNLKLAKLAIYQESMKGFPQGIPVVAMPYIMENQIDPNSFMTGPGQPDTDADVPSQKMGGANYFQMGGANEDTIRLLAESISDGSFDGPVSYYRDVFSNLSNENKRKVLDRYYGKNKYPVSFSSAPTYNQTVSDKVQPTTPVQTSPMTAMTYLSNTMPAGELPGKIPAVPVTNPQYAWDFNTPKQDSTTTTPTRKVLVTATGTRKPAKSAPVVEVDEEF